MDRISNWKAEARLGALKGSDEYDVCIVGGGIGGLVSGAVLVSRGYKVLLVEQDQQVGGYCASFRYKDFVFNTGADDITGLWEEGTVKLLFDELGLEFGDLFFRNKIHILLDGEVYPIPNSVEELIRYLSEKFPEEENIEAFITSAHKAYHQLYDGSRKYGVLSKYETVYMYYGEQAAMSYMISRSEAVKWVHRSFLDVLKIYFKNERILRFFGTLTEYTGTALEKTPGFIGLCIIMSVFLNGGFSVIGGMSNFSSRLGDFIMNHHGTVLKKQKVTNICADNGAVTGISTSGRRFKSNIVISNVNARDTFLKLLDKGNIEEDYLKQIENLTMSNSAFIVYLGVRHGLETQPDIFIDARDGMIVYFSKSCNAMAPTGCSAIKILLTKNVNYRDFNQESQEEYLRVKDMYTKQVMDSFRTRFPDLYNGILFVRAASPKTLERYVTMPEGAVFSSDQSIGHKRPLFKTPVRGLYLAGAAASPGAGVEGAIISARYCVNDICAKLPEL